MDTARIVTDAKDKFTQAVAHLEEDLKKLRTGRASAAMLDGVVVEAYGSAMPLVQVASVSAPEAQLLQITPFDPNNIQAISAAIRANESLGLNPMDDGRVVRVPIPALTEERRRDITRQVGAKLEDCMIRMRNVRHDSLAEIEKSKKDKAIGEDEAKRLVSQVEEAMSLAKQTADQAAKDKEKEIMTL